MSTPNGRPSATPKAIRISESTTSAVGALANGPQSPSTVIS